MNLIIVLYYVVDLQYNIVSYYILHYILFIIVYILFYWVVAYAPVPNYTTFLFVMIVHFIVLFGIVGTVSICRIYRIVLSSIEIILVLYYIVLY